MLKRAVVLSGVLFLAFGCAQKTKMGLQTQDNKANKRQEKAIESELMPPPEIELLRKYSIESKRTSSDYSFNWLGWTMVIKNYNLIIKKEFVRRKLKHTLQLKRGLYDEGVFSYQLSYEP